MQAHPEDGLEKEKVQPGTPGHLENVNKEFLDSVPSNSKNGANNLTEITPNQLVVYNPGGSDSGPEVPDSSDHGPLIRSSSAKALLSVGAFTVQCSKCLQWRIIPSKKRYEEIREKILQEPFYCETAQEWQPNMSCEDPPDISPDGNRLWAIDIPNIAQPPTGWERLLRFRGEGGTKFADVYYVSPSGKRLRSMVEVQRYLLEHPDQADQVNLSQFSFQIPKPLQGNYVRKRPRLTENANNNDGLGISKSLDPDEVNPLPLAGPDSEPSTELQLGVLGPIAEPPVYNSSLKPPSSKKKTSKPSSKLSSSSLLNKSNIPLEETTMGKKSF